MEIQIILLFLIRASPEGCEIRMNRLEVKSNFRAGSKEVKFFRRDFARVGTSARLKGFPLGENISVEIKYGRHFRKIKK